MYVIGHISMDRIIDAEENTTISTGGAPTYCGFYLTQLGLRIEPVSVVGRDFSRINEYIEREIPISRIRVDPSCSTTAYELRYRPDGSRRLRLLSKCRDLTVNDVSTVRGTAVLNPIAGEASLDLMRRIRNAADFLAIDAQGFARRFDADGNVYNKLDDYTLNSLLEAGNMIKLSSEDAEKLDIDKLSRDDRYILVTAGSKLGLLLHNGKRYVFRSIPTINAIDPTGAGDVAGCTLAWYLSRGEDIKWSLARAMAMSMEKVRHMGPYGQIDAGNVNELTDLLLGLIDTA
ncbi:MAG: PfkB family carbohydrate kinase [Thermocladium sp.]|jgi:sugar/nucleoside kinase (ribokinase family)